MSKTRGFLSISLNIYKNLHIHIHTCIPTYTYVCAFQMPCFRSSPDPLLPGGVWNHLDPWDQAGLGISLFQAQGNHNISPNPAVGSYYLDQSLGFHSPSTQKLFCILPAISWSFRMPFKYIVCLAPLYPRQTCTSGLWTIFLSGFSSCNHLLILFDLLLLFKANKQNLRAS